MLHWFSKRGVRRCPPGVIQISDASIRERIAFLGLTEIDLGVVASWSEACRRALPKVSEKFYQSVTAMEATRSIIEQHTSVAKQRPVLERYVGMLFDGRIDDAWLQFRAHVGKRHDDIDLDCMFYLGGYETLRSGFGAAVRQAGASPDEARQFDDAFGRLLYCDVAVTLNALMVSRAAKVKEAGEQQRRELIAGFVGRMANAVTRLSEGDLATRVADEHDADFDRIGKLFNEAVSRISRTITQVSEASEQVATAASEVTSGSQSSAHNATQQAGVLHQISSSLEEMTRASELTASNAAEGRKRVEGASQDADEGMRTMDELSSAMNRIKASSDETAKIVKTIDELAFQTNLLALNAAVEAARAGDAGRGFAVVAEEVRNLAIRSAEAARNTTTLIDGARQNAEAGVVSQDKVFSTLQKIHGSVKGTQDLMEEISRAALAQSTHVKGITTSIDDIARSTQSSAAAAEESASAAEELSGQAKALQETVSFFQIEPSESRALFAPPARRHLRSVPPLRSARR